MIHVLCAKEQRLSDVKYREDELNRSLEANKIETEAIVEIRARVDKMIDALQELLHISQQCLVKRSVSTCSSNIALISFIYYIKSQQQWHRLQSCVCVNNMHV